MLTERKLKSEISHCEVAQKKNHSCFQTLLLANVDGKRLREPFEVTRTAFVFFTTRKSLWASHKSENMRVSSFIDTSLR